MPGKIQIKLKCKQCNEVLEPDARFCHNCRYELNGGAACPQCKAPVESGWKACPECGIILDEEKRRQQEERQRREAEAQEKRERERRALEEEKRRDTEVKERQRKAEIERQKKEDEEKRLKDAAEKSLQDERERLRREREALEEEQRKAAEQKERESASSSGSHVTIIEVSVIIAVICIVFAIAYTFWPKTETKIEFVNVPGGCFQMGDTFGNGENDEKPVHEVCVSSFMMGKYEVTQGQWKKVMGSNPSYFKSCGDDCPVETVSWDDAQEFIKKLNRQSGKKYQYRLPTEAEWEYAARSGGKNEKYTGANDTDAVAWYEKNSGGRSHPVGQKKPNGLGLYDMSGNVWEWCGDWYGEKYYGRSPKDNPQGPSSGSYRVYRGGSWSTFPRLVRVARRPYNDPGYHDSYIGFRLVWIK